MLSRGWAHFLTPPPAGRGRGGAPVGGAGPGEGRGQGGAAPGVRRVRSPGGHRGWRKVVGSEPQPPPEPEPPGRGPPSGDPARPSDPPSSAARVAPGSGAAAGAAGGRREPGGCMMRSKHRGPGAVRGTLPGRGKAGAGASVAPALGRGSLELGVCWGNLERALLPPAAPLRGPFPGWARPWGSLVGGWGKRVRSRLFRTPI